MTPSGEAGGAEGSGPTGDGCQCDAENTPDSGVASSAPSTDEDPSDPENIPPPVFLVEAQPEADSGLPPSPIYKPSVSTNELRLPVGQFEDNKADLAFHAFTVQHDLTQAAVADILKLITCAAKYRTPYLMERFIAASVNLETLKVDCRVNG